MRHVRFSFYNKMSRHCQKEELHKNGEAVHRLYAEVLAALVDRLLKENRFRKSIPEEDIMRLQQVTPPYQDCPRPPHQG